MQSQGVRRPSVCLSVCLSVNFYTQVAISTTNMTRSPPNLHTMVPTWAYIHDVLKVKVKIKVKVTWYGHFPDYTKIASSSQSGSQVCAAHCIVATSVWYYNYKTERLRNHYHCSASCGFEIWYLFVSHLFVSPEFSAPAGRCRYFRSRISTPPFSALPLHHHQSKSARQTTRRYCNIWQ